MPLTPKNRKEEWLEGLVDHETDLTPKNRSEAWMKEIIEASGGGGGGGLVVVESYAIGQTPYYSSVFAALSGGMQVVFSDGVNYYPVIQYALSESDITLTCGMYIVNLYPNDAEDTYQLVGWPTNE